MYRGFIQIPILIAIIGITVLGGAGYISYIFTNSRYDVSSREVNLVDKQGIVTGTTTTTVKKQSKSNALKEANEQISKEKTVSVNTQTSSTTKNETGTILHGSSKIMFYLAEEDGELHAFDEHGQHTGLLDTSSFGPFYLEEQIPNSTYDIFGAYVLILYPPRTNGWIEVRGIKSIDTILQIFYDDAKYYYPLSLQIGSVATIPIVFSNDEQVDVGPLQLDHERDGIVDKIIHGQSF